MHKPPFGCFEGKKTEEKAIEHVGERGGGYKAMEEFLSQ